VALLTLVAMMCIQHSASSQEHKRQHSQLHLRVVKIIKAVDVWLIARCLCTVANPGDLADVALHAITRIADDTQLIQPQHLVAGIRRLQQQDRSQVRASDAVLPYNQSVGPERATRRTLRAQHESFGYRPWQGSALQHHCRNATSSLARR